MLNIELTWQEAAVTSGCLLAGAAAGRMLRSPGLSGSAVGRALARPRVGPALALIQEAGILFGLFALWQFASSFSVTSPGQAWRRGWLIWHAERLIHLPSEAAVQHPFLTHPLLVQVINLYYAALHFIVLIACLIWLFARYRPQYRRARTTVVLFTGASLLVQLMPVAPPRLLAGDGMVDTALRYGQSVYGTYAGFEPDQLSAMPSVHIGWALLVALLIVHVSRSRWRWLALAYPVVTTAVVVITANHYWMDGIVAWALLAAALLVQRASRSAWRSLTALRDGRLRGRGHVVTAFWGYPLDGRTVTALWNHRPNGHERALGATTGNGHDRLGGAAAPAVNLSGDGAERSLPHP